MIFKWFIHKFPNIDTESITRLFLELKGPSGRLTESENCSKCKHKLSTTPGWGKRRINFIAGKKLKLNSVFSLSNIHALLIIQTQIILPKFLC